MTSLSFEHPYPSVQALVDSIDAYPPFYSECLQELAKCYARLTFTQQRYALEVILGMAWLEKTPTLFLVK